MSRLRVGVIGAGSWGKNHVRTLASLPETSLTAVCDMDPGTRDRLTKQYPGTLVTDSVSTLLERVEAVVIASSARTHAELGRKAVEAGIPALVEKPFALTVADAEGLADLAAHRGVPVLAGHLLEYHPVVEQLRRLVTERALGDLYYLYSQRVNLGQVRPDENAPLAAAL